VEKLLQVHFVPCHPLFHIPRAGYANENGKRNAIRRRETGPPTDATILIYMTVTTSGKSRALEHITVEKRR